MQVSDKGEAYLESREGVVLKTYRDSAGVLTIGAGLTASSGVIKPKLGMTITRAQATSLLRQALAKNYEPRVTKAMPGAKQNEFDGGLSFDFNTGAIDRATWVKQWVTGASAASVRASLGAWNKAGGKVLPGLKRRRAEEADIILADKWPADLRIAQASVEPGYYAEFVVSVTAEEIVAIRDGFRKTGYEPGDAATKVLRSAVDKFQADHGLTVDGKIGKATLSTLQRELDARSKTKTAAGTAATGTAVTTGADVITPPPAPPSVDLPAVEPSTLSDHALSLAGWIGIVALVVGSLWLAYLAWHYRDIIAARMAKRLPKTATWLRSF
ncbi:hypothetical protein ASD44_09770 [Mesorhizobium sp. Root554]|uniref:lysozyme n=1 Tax=unclassified Mesorhizobium TaxID=325217 RepID=UPI0006F33D68|nr:MULTISPECIES: peptidoglycan-binding protein [unclassified Mesorhizobium]KQZ14329.1 hypothetical protein ASD27_09780 [Mesorhizobium sp. Root1471]KQZ36840.1 hypothetical protein ASD44_09770 [Mesorhizobium sp. Root554]